MQTFLSGHGMRDKGWAGKAGEEKGREESPLAGPGLDS